MQAHLERCQVRVVESTARCQAQAGVYHQLVFALAARTSICDAACVAEAESCNAGV